MIFNANLISMTTPPVADGNGGQANGVTTTFSSIRCSIDYPKQARVGAMETIEVDGRKVDVVAVLRVKLPLPSNYTPEAGGDVQFQADGLASQSLRIAQLLPFVHGGQSHYEMLLCRR